MFGTATSIVAGKLWQRQVLAYCAPPSGDNEAVFKVRVSDYPALLQPYGSVRLGINPVAGDDPDGDFWPFLINRDGFGDFHVLDSECRHNRCVVPAYDNLEFLIRCQCHGSTYDIEGNNLLGPATEPLFKYNFEFDGNDTLTIQIPCWKFETQLSVLPGGPNSRIRLDFPAFPKVTYEVSFSQHLQGPWTRASFATTPGGPADQTSLTSDPGGPVSVYLDRATASGFYAVGMALSEV